MKKIYTLVAMLMVSAAMFAQTDADLMIMLSELSEDSVQATMTEMQQYNRCSWLGNREAAQYLVSKMESVGLLNVTIDSFYVYPEINTTFDDYIYNVRGFIPGNGSSDSVVLVGAHYDMLSLNAAGEIQSDLTGGADNNAAGVALMLEVARVLTAHQFQPNNTVEFIALDGFELGRAGSLLDAQQRASNQENVKLMINNDRVAYDPQNMHMMTILWYENAMTQRSDASLMLESFTQLLPIMMDVAGNLPESQNGDAYSYASQGFPPVFFRETTLSPFHHTDGDVIGTCNLSNVVELAKANMTLIIHYAYHDVFSLPGVASYERQNLHISPNPTTGTIRIDFADAELDEMFVEIYNAQGQMVSCHNVTIENPTISLQSLPSGFYFLKSYNQNSTTGTAKILKW
ncbi:MAG: M28 family peptidase [Bacteroidales bacterium]|nr:M28 family peptidase [Bacteroidales bacterium]